MNKNKFGGNELSIAIETNKARQSTTKKAMFEFKIKDSFAVIEYLCSLNNILLAVQVFSDLMNYFYWKKKDITTAIAFGRAGVHHALVNIETYSKKDKSSRTELLQLAKLLSYNIASFSWTGWDEKGIEIFDSELKTSLDAAKTCLRLTRKLRNGHLQLSRAYCLLANSQFAIGNYKNAKKSYTKAAQYAKKADVKGEELLSLSLRLLIDILTVKNKDSYKAKLDTYLKELKRTKDGKFFVNQIETAQKVFSCSQY